jgi:hypothetical protein
VPTRKEATFPLDTDTLFKSVGNKLLESGKEPVVVALWSNPDSPVAHRRGRVIETDARRLLVLHVSSDDQEREQSSEDYPNVGARQNSSAAAFLARSSASRQYTRNIST